MINKITLNNGVRIVTEKIPSVRSVAMGIWVRTGSRNEDKTNNGVSHFIEHMMFKGTEKLNAREIAELFDGIGGQINAGTSKEYTCYYAKVIDQHFDLAFTTLTDMFFESRFGVEEIDKERNVVLEEIAMYEDTPDDLVHDLIGSASFGEHALGQPVIGKREIIESITRQDIIKYIDEQYLADRIVITVAGNFDDNVYSKISKIFDKMSYNTNAQLIVKPTRQQQQIICKKTTEQTHICLAHDGIEAGNSNMYALGIVNTIIGGGMSSRLFQDIRESRGLAYAVYSYHSAFVDTGVFTTYVGTAPKQVTEVLTIIKDMYSSLQENGISEAELNKTKEQLKGMLMLSLESTNSRMSRLAKNELFLNKQISLDETLEKINAVSLADCKKICALIFENPPAIAAIGQLEQVPW